MIATIFFDRSLQSGFRVEMQFFLNNVVVDDLKQLESSTGFLELINSYKKLVSDKIKNDRRRNMPLMPLCLLTYNSIFKDSCHQSVNCIWPINSGFRSRFVYYIFFSSPLYSQMLFLKLELK
jgi:hypothetical protein